MRALQLIVRVSKKAVNSVAGDCQGEEENGSCGGDQVHRGIPGAQSGEFGEH
jgi:hypothetical protein